MLARITVALALLVSILVLPRVADATAPAIASQILPHSGAMHICLARGEAALTAASFTGGGRIAETVYAYRSDYTARFHCFPDGGGVVIVAGPNADACTGYMGNIVDRF
jgi:hypothetical protein